MIHQKNPRSGACDVSQGPSSEGADGKRWGLSEEGAWTLSSRQ